MNSLLKYILIYVSIVPLVTVQVHAGREKGIRNKKGRYFLESQSNYTTSACQKYNSDKGKSTNYYLAKCSDGGYKSVSQIKKLSKDVSRVEKKIIKDNVLSELKRFTLQSIKKNENGLIKLKKCLAQQTPQCEKVKEALLFQTRKGLPELRQLMALTNTTKRQVYNEGSIRRSYRYFVDRDIEHEVDEFDIKPLSDKELEQAQKISDAVLNEEKQKYLKSVSDDYPCVKRSAPTYTTKSCTRHAHSRLSTQYFLNYKEQIKPAKDEYRKQVSENPIFGMLSVRGDESDQEILEDVGKSIDRIIEANNKTYDNVYELEDDELPKLTVNGPAFEAFMKLNGPSQILCDVSEELKADYSADQWKDTALFMGGVLVGSGVCLFTGGLACGVAVAVLAEGYSGYESLSTIDQTREAAISNIGDVQSYNDSVTEGVTGALLAVVPGFAPGKKVATNLYRGYKSGNAGLSSFDQTFVGKWIKGNHGGQGRREVDKLRQTEFPLEKSYKDKDAFTEGFKDYVMTSPQVNKRWIDNAMNDEAAMYLDIENAALKRLNDGLGDKDLVTALTNMHKQLMFNKVNKMLSEKYPNVEFDMYSDFKSLRFAFKPKDMPESLQKRIQTDLNLVFENANQEYAKMIKNLDGIPDSEEAQKWFQAGYGHTADQAGQAAKKARGIDRDIPAVTTFDSVKDSVKDDIRQIDNYHSALKARKYDKLTESVTFSGDKTLSIPVIETIRKVKVSQSEVDKLVASSGGRLSPKEAHDRIESIKLMDAIRKKFGVELNDREAAQMLAYNKRLDTLTPGLWQEERVTVGLDKADYGGFTGDVTGMGAKNIQQVAKDVFKTDGATPESLIKQTRRGEQAVTQTFEDIKKNFKTTVKKTLKKNKIPHETKCSGDDCVVVPTRELTIAEEKAVIGAFKDQGNPSQYRLSFIPKDVTAKTRTQLATHGELIEKEFRKIMAGVGKDQIPPERLAKVTMGTKMPGSTGSGKVTMYLGVGKGAKLTESEVKVLQKAYKDAVAKANKGLAEENTRQVFNYADGGLDIVW
jgi:hypothetical protein